MISYIVVNWYFPQKCVESIQTSKVILNDVNNITIAEEVSMQYKGALWKGIIESVWGILYCFTFFIKF